MTNSTDLGPLDTFKNCYLIQICPYVNFPICIIGSLLSILNIMVFSRKPMSVPINTIFLHLSIVELAALLINIPSTWHVCVQHKDDHQHVRYWEVMHLLIRVSTYTCYYISVWLTVMLTIWRYSAIAHPFKERAWCNSKNTRVMLIMGYAFGVLLSQTTYFSMHIVQNKENGNYTIEYDEKNKPLLYNINFILYAAAMKLIPSVILSVLSYKLIAKLFDVRNRSLVLSRNSSEPEQKIADIKQQTDNTTRMLLGVLLAFLLSEVPSGILGLFCIIRGRTFREQYFSPTIHLFNTIRLFSISISFFVYYNLSQQFRSAFKAMFTNSRESRSDISNDTPL